MKKFFLSLLIVPAIASANFSADYLPYSDPPEDLETAVSASFLTEEGIIRGNPDGTLKAGRLLNRAEFVTIAVRLLPAMSPLYGLDCFPDVSGAAWFAETVCLAKELGIVRGNEVPGVHPDQWFFEPSRPVQYEEAVKVFIHLYELPVVAPLPGEQWYVPYLLVAENIDVTIDKNPGDQLSRGDIIRLTANFYAYSRGQLPELQAAQEGDEYVVELPEEELDDSCDPIQCENGDIFASCAEDGTEIAYLIDPCAEPEPEEEVVEEEEEPQEEVEIIYDENTDISTNSEFLLLGEQSHALAAIDVFSNTEPLLVQSFTVILSADSASVDSFTVYAENGQKLGRATKDSTLGSRHFRLSTKTQTIEIPHRETRTFYTRPTLKSHESGGLSGEDITVSEFRIDAEGVWSTQDYSESESGVFSTFSVSRSQILRIENVQEVSAPLIEGLEQQLATFEFAGERSDGTADLHVKNIDFTLENSDDVTVTNIYVKSVNGDTAHPCTIVDRTVSCIAIPESIGTFTSNPRAIVLFGDVSIEDSEGTNSLRITINDPGSPGVPGDITWSDGTSDFQWVPFTQPVVRGTHFSQ